MIGLAFAAAALIAGVNPSAEVRETRCAWMVQPPGGAIRMLDATGVNVMDQAALPGPFAPARPADAQALQCGRTSIVPAEHDDEVIELGVPLFIVDVATPSVDRQGVLEIVRGRFRYRLISGALTEAESQAVLARLNAFQRRAQRAE